jgi:Spy/CpxP family protein refolding chaperone
MEEFSMIRILLLAGILMSGLLMAQRGGGGGAGGSGMGTMPMRPIPPKTKADQIADRLKLNDQQKDQLLDILAAARQQAAPVREEMDKQRADIASALIDGKPQDEVQKLVDGYAAVAGRMASVEGDAFAKICAMLKPNQQSRSGQAFEIMAGMFISERAR